ncbi:DegT/DnrJ/EryC1/StrS family aminotransferase [Petroclostridium xylanilyticum]|uniref:DegT/DnrJ/EryC1/StrS family aminotransferase n=1 Tax=Petroclostridium xylanilyticum TaxID=1792311 RepID=UPI000B985750|nr:DegT/DnrJ/EryC1/StrS family aminotransferase [Petroclostridium xylanilyticum]
MTIPLLDLQKQYNSIKKEIDAAIKNVLSSGQYIMGPEVKYFEQEVAQFVGCKYAISCANGTDALVLALHALGIGKDDEVITTPFTFFATAEAISRVGAIPVFVDVRKDTYNIDSSKIENKITSKTKAIIPVHIFGQPAEMDSIVAIAEKYDLYIVEDACQAIGARYKGQRVGSIGDIACFSFFPTKNLGAFGDGGIITTNNERLNKIVRALRMHGSGNAGKNAFDIMNGIQEESQEIETRETIYNPTKYYNYLIGYNSRLDEIQAAILRVKLKYLEQWNAMRRQHAIYYNEKLKNTSLILPEVLTDADSVYHLYILQTDRRDEIVSYLKQKGISAGIYYPVPLHLQKAYEHLGYSKGDLLVAEYLSKRTFALPLYPELTKEEQDYIVGVIYEFEKLNTKHNSQCTL